jgi:glycosyltransferase involved in cell wall biosynthesis
MSELHRKVEGSGLDIGFLCQGWPPDQGGVESHAEDLARRLARRGHRVHVLALDYSDGREPYSVRTSTQDGVTVRRYAYRYHDQRALADVVVSRRADDAVAAWMAETPCDVVHVHHLTGWGMGALRAIADLGQPLVMTLHDYWPLCPRGQMLRHVEGDPALVHGEICARPEPATCATCLARTWPHLLPSTGAQARGPSGEPLASDAEAAAARTAFALAMLAQPQRLFAPSVAARAVYAAAGFPAAKIQVVENGIEAAELAAAVQAERGRAVRAPGEVRLGFLGTALPSKGALELAQALVEADVPGLSLEVHASLPSYHGDARYVDALRALAARDARIRLHGPYARAELPRILAALDGVAAPSRWQEVFGLTVREARAAGLPVLVSDRGDLARVAEDGAAGLVVPADDRAAWVAALRRFGTDAAARARWAARTTPLRDGEAMMLELERAYVESILEVTGRMPQLVHPLAGLGAGAASGAAAGPARPSAAASAASSAASSADATPVAKKGFLRRLFGA